MSLNDNFQIDVQDKIATVQLRTSMDMAIAEKFLETIRQCLDQKYDLVLEANEVMRLSTPCLQIMMAAQMACEKEGQSFSIAHPSEEMKQVMGDLGLYADLIKGRI